MCECNSDILFCPNIYPQVIPQIMTNMQLFRFALRLVLVKKFHMIAVLAQKAHRYATSFEATICKSVVLCRCRYNII